MVVNRPTPQKTCWLEWVRGEAWVFSEGCIPLLQICILSVLLQTFMRRYLSHWKTAFIKTPFPSLLLKVQISAKKQPYDWAHVVNWSQEVLAVCTRAVTFQGTGTTSSCFEILCGKVNTQNLLTLTIIIKHTQVYISVLIYVAQPLALALTHPEIRPNPHLKTFIFTFMLLWPGFGIYKDVCTWKSRWFLQKRL